MLRYDRQTKPGLVALYDIRPGNGAGPFLQPRSPHRGTLNNACIIVQWRTWQLGQNVTPSTVADDKDVSPLQLSSVRRHRQPYPMSVVSSDRCRKADYTDSSAWTHHKRSYAGITLATGSTPYRVQAGYTDVQDTSPHYTAVSVRWVSVAVVHRSSSPLMAHRLHCRVSYHGLRLGWVIGRLMSPVCGSGTSCLLPCFW